jgi:hypothetical protein
MFGNGVLRLGFPTPNGLPAGAQLQCEAFKMGPAFKKFSVMVAVRDPPPFLAKNSPK